MVEKDQLIVNKIQTLMPYLIPLQKGKAQHFLGLVIYYQWFVLGVTTMKHVKDSNPRKICSLRLAKKPSKQNRPLKDSPYFGTSLFYNTDFMMQFGLQADFSEFGISLTRGGRSIMGYTGRVIELPWAEVTLPMRPAKYVEPGEEP